MKRFYILLLFIAFSVNLSAQKTRFNESGQSTLKSFPVHVSDKLNNSELSKKLSKITPNSYPENKKKASVDNIGDTRNFWVSNLETDEFESKSFQLMKKGPASQIWFEVAEITNGHLTNSVADSILEYLEEKSNPYSYNPNLGIVEQCNQVFGNPPNSDGDGLVDFLITDIIDGWNATDGGSYVAGFFYAVDQYSAAALEGYDLETNERDILYIDSYPGIYDGQTTDPTRPLSTLAHEYQHLIHFNYNTKLGSNEYTFINEAQSNFSSLLNGYFPHNSIVDYLDDTNVPIFQWNRDDVLPDYGRAAAFSSYLWDQLGFEKAGNLTKTFTSGVTAIEDAIESSGSSLTFEQLLVNWGLANLINDTTNAGSRAYGYAHPFLTNLKVSDIDNSAGSSFSDKNVKVMRGGIYYIGLGQVGNLNVTASWSSSYCEARLVTVQGLQKEITVLNNGTTYSTTPGVTYDNAYLMLVNAEPSEDETVETTGASFIVSASGEQTYELSSDSTYSDTPKFYWQIPYYNASDVGRLGFSNKYTAPFDALLHTLQLYIVSGTDSDSGEPIQIKGTGTLRIAAYTDNNGKPGTVMAADSIDFSTIGIGWQSFNVEKWNLNLTEGTVFHVLYEPIVPTVDSDVNSIPLRLDDGTGAQNVTNILTGPNTYETMFTDEDTFGQHGISNKVVYGKAPTTANEDEFDSAPEAFALHQNYPNPFNPSTTINFNLPQASEVRLTVFNMLGQKVASLVNTKLASGSHSVTWNAQNAASGIYIYKIEADNFQKSMKMIYTK